MEQRQALIEALKAGEVLVNFTKIDGTERSIRGTLNESLIPECPSGDDYRKRNTSLVTLYDLDQRDWRSFRVENLNSWRPW